MFTTRKLLNIKLQQHADSSLGIIICRMGAKLEDLPFKKANIAPGPGRYESAKKQSIPSMKFGTG